MVTEKSEVKIRKVGRVCARCLCSCEDIGEITSWRAQDKVDMTQRFFFLKMTLLSYWGEK